MIRILLVDEESATRRYIYEILTEQGYKVDLAQDDNACLTRINNCKYNVIFLDIKKQKSSGMNLLEAIQKVQPNSAVLMVSAQWDINQVVEAIKKGAFGILEKPSSLNDLILAVHNAIDKNRMTYQVVQKQPGQLLSKVPIMLGESPKMLRLKSDIKKSAQYDMDVLIQGPNGAGKELVAQRLHYGGARAKGPLVEVNCAAIPADMIESELFGHEKGAFTGAYNKRIGKFEEANGGTIFLDEIGNMSYEAQAKVLRVLETRRIRRVGGSKDITLNCRVVAATNSDLEKMITQSTFRIDLYYRLEALKLKVPSLNDRREDIPLLFHHFMDKICRENKVPIPSISDEAMEVLKNLDYPGNIRQLRNIIQRLVVYGGPEISAEDVERHA